MNDKYHIPKELPLLQWGSSYQLGTHQKPGITIKEMKDPMQIL